MGSLMEPVQYLKLKVACQEKSFRNRLVELKLPVAEVKFSQTFLQLCLWLLMILPAHIHVDHPLLQLFVSHPNFRSRAEYEGHSPSVATDDVAS